MIEGKKKMINQRLTTLGTINKAWAAAIVAPLAEWLIGLTADSLWQTWQIAMPDGVQMALVSLIIGLVVYRVPNLSTDSTAYKTQQAGV